MAKVIIDGIEYVPKCDIQALTDERCKKCLEALAKMLRIGRDNNMRALAYSAIYALSPELVETEEVPDKIDLDLMTIQIKSGAVAYNYGEDDI